MTFINTLRSSILSLSQFQYDPTKRCKTLSGKKKKKSISRPITSNPVSYNAFTAHIDVSEVKSKT